MKRNTNSKTLLRNTGNGASSSKRDLLSSLLASASAVSLPKSIAPRDKTLMFTEDERVSTGIDFGHFKTPKTTANKPNHSTLSGLVTQTLQGGAAQALGGGLAAAGVKRLADGIAELFHHRDREPTLVPFSLPEVQNVSISTGAATPVASSSLTAAVDTKGRSQAEQREQVVSIVKQALLTSSSLNDVISEI